MPFSAQTLAISRPIPLLAPVIKVNFIIWQ
jgi:hypothetical protein